MLICYYIWRIWRNWDDRRRQRQELTNNAINNLVFNRNTTLTFNSQQNNENISGDAQHLINNVQPSSSNNETNNICNRFDKEQLLLYLINIFFCILGNTNVYDDLPPSYASLIM